MKKVILESYADGSHINVISESLNIDKSAIIDTLIQFKESSRFKKTFTDDFKKMIAERDINGVARRTIASELKLNAYTVKKACEQFGQSNKERASSENAYTRIEGNFSMDVCPSCNSKKVNEVDENTVYCLSCGSEYIHKEDHILKINWEYLE